MRITQDSKRQYTVYQNHSKVCCDLTGVHFRLFLGIMEVVFSGLKRIRAIQIVISPKLKSQLL